MAYYPPRQPQGGSRTPEGPLAGLGFGGTGGPAGALSGGTYPQDQGYGFSVPGGYPGYQTGPGLAGPQGYPPQGYLGGGGYPPPQGYGYPPQQGYNTLKPGGGLGRAAERRDGGFLGYLAGQAQGGYQQPGPPPQALQGAAQEKLQADKARQRAQTPQERLEADKARQRAQGSIQSAQRGGAQGAPVSGGPPQLRSDTGLPQAQPGIDRINPGIAEQVGDKAQRSLWRPGAAEQYWNQVQGQFNAPRADIRAPGISNRAEEAYQDYRRSPTEAGLDPYYENQRRKTTEGLDQAFAARGMHGSSAALDQTSEALTNLGAEQANREADFELRRLGLGGQLGRGADISSGAIASEALQRGLANEGNQLQWLTSGANVAGAADQGLLGRLGLAGSLAGQAQNAREARLQNAFQNTLMPAQILGSAAQDTYGKIIGADEQAYNAALAAALGLPAEALAQGRYSKQDVWNDASNTSGLISGLISGFGL